MDGFGFFNEARPEPIGSDRLTQPSQITCLLTIHGIGFQQARSGERQGYADQLHWNLGKYLDASLLGGDPDQRVPCPIYIVGSTTNRTGLDRLNSDHELARGARIAHVAVVYSNLEQPGFDVGAFLGGSLQALGHLFRYIGPWGVIRVGLPDLLAMIRHHGRTPSSTGSRLSLRVRRDKLTIGVTGRLIPLRASGTKDPASGLLVVLKQLADDVFAYVRRRTMRDEVCDFVRSALLRLAQRPDVGAVVINSHSQGTVVAFDALRGLDAQAARKVRWFVTAGSPLRKYTDLFGWTDEVGQAQAPWTNFWDPRDPVADPLVPPGKWRPGADSATCVGQRSLFRCGAAQLIMVDWKVDNLANSATGGLQAHNYWDNEPEFVRPLADILRDLSVAPTTTRVLVGHPGGAVR